MAGAPFPLPAHRTGRAVFRHPALGQELTPLPTEDSWCEAASGPAPAHRAATCRGAVIPPDSIACACQSFAFHATIDVCRERSQVAAPLAVSVSWEYNLLVGQRVSEIS